MSVLSLQALEAFLVANKVRLSLQGDQDDSTGPLLAVSAATGVITPEIAAAIRHWKGELLAKLAAPIQAPLQEPLQAPSQEPIQKSESTPEQPRSNQGFTAQPESLPQVNLDEKVAGMPLSWSQQRMWFTEALHGPNPGYHIQGAFKLLGNLNTEALRQAFEQIIMRHESLRTVFAEQHGEPIQRLQTDISFDFEWHDLTDDEQRQSLFSGAGSELISQQVPEQSIEQQLTQLMQAEGRKPFDLRTDLMLRAQLIKVSEQAHVLFFTMHHIAGDGWSMGILIQELNTCYAIHTQQNPQPNTPQALAPLPYQYSDYCAWQRAALGSLTQNGANTLPGSLSSSLAGSAAGLAFWRDYLQDAPLLHRIPLDNHRPRQPVFDGDIVKQRLSRQLSARLEQQTKQNQCTLFMLLHTAFGLLLNRWSRQDDILIGTPVNNRNKQEFAGLIGFFVNTVVLRCQLPQQATFSSLLAQAKTDIVNAFAHQDMPFDAVVDMLKPERSQVYNPVFQVLFALQNNEVPAIKLANLDMVPLHHDERIAKFDISLNMRQEGEHLHAIWEYNPAIFRRSTIAAMSQAFEVLLQAIAVQPNTPAMALPLMSQQQQLAEQLRIRQSPSVNLPATLSVGALFAEQVARHGEAEAVRFRGESLSYRELNQRANQLANWLLQSGALAVNPNSEAITSTKPEPALIAPNEMCIGIALPRSIELIVTVLAVVKCGAAYVPFDLAYPVSRLAHMQQDTGVNTLISLQHGHAHQKQPDLSWFTGEHCIYLDDPGLRAQVAAQSPQDPVLSQANSSRPHASQTNAPETEALQSKLAYINFSSGSTGQPKGIAVQQSGVLRLVHQAEFVELSHATRMLQLATVSFDAATFEIWGALLNGGTLVLYPDNEVDLHRLTQVLVEEQLNTCFLTSALFEQWVWQWNEQQPPQGIAHGAQILVGGDVSEPATFERARQLLPGVALFNVYGPTENTTFTTAMSINRNFESTSVPLGQAIKGDHIFVLSDKLNMLPHGAVGELCVSGPGVARGYLNRPELSAEKFVAHPFVSGSAQCLYRTGDLVRYLPDGNLIMLGRADEQVKWRGYRIEPGEIERQLQHCEWVKIAKVLLVKADDGNARLVAYIVPDKVEPERVVPEKAEPEKAPGMAPKMSGVSHTQEHTPEQEDASFKTRTMLHLRQHLPEFMLPSALITLEQLPLTVNGKLDKAALPPIDTALMSTSHVALTTHTEQWLATVFAELLHVPESKLGGDAHFFELGGHSLLTVRLLSRIEAHYHTRLAIKQVFVAPQLSELAAKIDAALAEPAGALVPSSRSELVGLKAMPRAPVASHSQASSKTAQNQAQSRFPLSFSQQRLWFIEHMNGPSAQYNMPAAFWVDNVDISAVEFAITHIVRRHEVLRCVYADEPLPLTEDDAGEARSSEACSSKISGNDSGLNVYQTCLPAAGFRIQYHRWPGAAPTTGGGLRTGEVINSARLTPAQHELVEAAFNRPFDLSRDYMLRASFYRCEGDNTPAHRQHKQSGLLVVTMHHIASDGWSMAIWRNEFLHCYQQALGALSRADNKVDNVNWQQVQQTCDAQLPKLAVQYPDFAVWQQSQQADMTSQLDYWREQLAGIEPVHGLRLDYPRPTHKQSQGQVHADVLPNAVAQGLNALAQQFALTPFMLLLSALSLLISRHSNRYDVVMGTPVANRRDPRLENLIGFFVNTLVLRVNTRHHTLGEYLAHVKTTHIEALSHQDVPFEQLVDALNTPRNTAHSPLVQIVLTTGDDFVPDFSEELSQEQASVAMPAFSAVVSDSVASKFDLEINLAITRDGVQIRWIYDKALFCASHISQMHDHLASILTAMANTSGQAEQLPLHRLYALPVAQQTAMQRFHRQAPASATTEPLVCLHRHVEKHAAAQPNAVALVYPHAGGRQTLTYGELNQQANQLACYLREHFAIQPDNLVALSLPRSPAMLVGLLAILKAGGAYVPLDPAYPESRLAYVLNDARPVLVLTQSGLQQRFSAVNCPVVALDALDLQGYGGDDLPCNGAGVSVNHLAYVIYTSGSTGKPKGVLVEHGHVDRLFVSSAAHFAFSERDTWSLFHSFAFDFSVWEIWGALRHGGQLVIVHQDTTQNPEQFWRLLLEQQITVLSQTPAPFYSLADVAIEQPQMAGLSNTTALRYVIFGGDALDIPRLRLWMDAFGEAAPQLINMYGITETTVHVTYRKLTKADTERHSSVIGTALNDLRCYICDDQQHLLPAGVPGELYVGGAGVTRGYLNRDALTAQRFLPEIILPDTFAPPATTNGLTDTATCYRTGDIARWTAQGELEYLGRIDNQVKVRGYRIELGEIEQALHQTGLVQTSVVLVKNSANSQQLLAFVVPLSSVTTAQSFQRQVQENLRQQLPEFMVPAQVILTEAMPLTSNGKIDRKVLLQQADSQVTTQQGREPTHPVEVALCQLWQAVLKVAMVWLDDNYFSLGGDSIQVVRMVRLARKQNLHFTVKDVFTHQTAGELAAFIVQNQVGAASSGGADLSLLEPQVFDSEHFEDCYVTTAMQQEMWREHGNNAKLWLNAVYQPTSCYEIRGSEAMSLTPEFVQNVIESLVARYPTLRSQFFYQDNPVSASPPTNQLMQRVSRHSKVPFTWLDWSGQNETQQQQSLQTLIQHSHNTPFLLGEYCVRFTCIKLELDLWALVICSHHAVEDGWGFVEFLNALFQALFSQSLAGLPRDNNGNIVPATNVFKEHVALEQEAMGDEQLAKNWQTLLATYQPMQLASLNTDATAQQLNSNAHNKIDFSLPDHLTHKLQTCARAQQLSLKTLLIFAWQRVLSRLTEQAQITVDVVTNGRSGRLSDPLNAVGLFWNLLPVCSVVTAPEHVTELQTTEPETTEKNAATKATLATLFARLLDVETNALLPRSKLPTLLPANTFTASTAPAEQGWYSTPHALTFAAFNYVHFHNIKRDVVQNEQQVTMLYASDRFHYPVTLSVSASERSQQASADINTDSSDGIGSGTSSEISPEGALHLQGRFEYSLRYFNANKANALREQWLQELAALAVLQR